MRKVRIMGNILKANQVRVEGPLRLNLHPAARSNHDGSHSSPASPGVRIIESDRDFAVLEVTCPCGRITHVHCDYAAANVAPALQGLAQQ